MRAPVFTESIIGTDWFGWFSYLPDRWIFSKELNPLDDGTKLHLI
jgi:hypothetical protein